DLAAEHKDLEVDLARLDLADTGVYDMLCRGDSVGVFQVESRAQMATLPRLRPRTFYDSSWRWHFFAPAPSRAAPFTPTSVEETVGKRWCTTTRLSSRRWAGHWASRCSRSSSCRSPGTSPGSPVPRRTGCAGRWAPNGPPRRWRGSGRRS